MIYFCPKCHKKIIPPRVLSQIKTTGEINLKCGDEKCTGKVKIKSKVGEVKNEEVVVSK